MNEFVITFDIDWAPDFMIDAVASLVNAKGVRATWFVTHACAAVERLRENSDLFELGIHPNFLPGSTHGHTPMEVLSHLLAIVPEAISVRSHAVVQSSPILELMINRTPLMVDSTLFLPHVSHIHPIEYEHFGGVLLRIPFFWSDDYEVGKKPPQWDLMPYLEVEGLKVFDFHPIHVYLNSDDERPYQKLKQERVSLNEITPQMASPYIQNGRGAQTLLMNLLDYLGGTGRSLRLSDIYDHWRGERYGDGKHSSH
jgi:Polysaccharide deacetylase